MQDLQHEQLHCRTGLEPAQEDQGMVEGPSSAAPAPKAESEGPDVESPNEGKES